MITEHELEKALLLKDEIKELKVFLSKLENCNISTTITMNSKVSIDSNMIVVTDYTIATLKRFHLEIVMDYKHRLHALETEYNSIILSPEEAFENALLEEEDGE